MRGKRARRGGPPPATDDEIAVVLRLRAVSGAEPTVGGPVRCPECSCWGLAESLDRDTLRFDYRCPSCSTRWVLSMVAVRAAREASTEQGPRPTAVAIPGPALVPDSPEAPVVRIEWGARRTGDPGASPAVQPGS